MTRDQALELLVSPSSHDRFQAARTLEKLALNADHSALRKALHKETDAYVTKRLEKAIENCLQDSGHKHQQVSLKEDVSEIIRAQRSAAIEWISGLLLHEIGAKIGLIELHAKQEIINYESSKTRKDVLFLQDIFDGIASLRSASATPKFEEFAMSTLIDEIIDIESEQKNVVISRVGERPGIVLGDRTFLKLAICNGVRNAIEAVLSVRNQTEDETEEQLNITDIIVSWGLTDTDHWVSIIDHGPGISNGDQVFNIGTTTKSGHIGFGLAIAKQAMDSMEGSIKLIGSAGGGAIYELRWGKTT